MNLRKYLRAKVFAAVSKLVETSQLYRVEQDKKQFKFCGERVEISHRAFLWGVGELEIGNDVCIQGFTHMFCAGGISIGDGTRISSNCAISSITHPVPRLNKHDTILKRVRIGHHVWIGMGATILPGISIGDYSVVGAGSVVTKDVPPCCIVVGNPAQVMKNFSKPSQPS